MGRGEKRERRGGYASQKVTEHTKRDLIGQIEGTLLSLMAPHPPQSAS